MGQGTAGQAMTRKKELKWLALAALIPLAAYLWGLWYYGGLYQSGQLLPTYKVTSDTLFYTLAQNIAGLLPELLAGTTALVLLGRERFTGELGQCVEQCIRCYFVCGKQLARLIKSAIVPEAP